MSDPTTKRFSAIAFDFDGTLVDTLSLHYQAYRRVFEEMGLELTEEQFFRNIGGKATEAIPMFIAGRESKFSVSEIHARKKSLIKEIFAAADLEILPTARLLEMFRGKVPIALVSSGSRQGIQQLLARLDWSNYFDVIVTGEDTSKSKPNPMPYLLAAELLGIKPSEIAVFEDTAAGLESARLAGMIVYDVSVNSSINGKV